jgi:anti-sigma regulatory factor (Ser/Thr protein kinase)
MADTMQSVDVDLPLSVRAPALARRRVAELMTAWGRTEDGETAVLLVSELVTNAVRHTGSAPRLTVSTGDGRLRCAVHDGDPHHPVTHPVSVENEAGRGLLLVAALSAAWGVEDEPSGKLIWFELRT